MKARRWWIGFGCLAVATVAALLALGFARPTKFRASVIFELDDRLGTLPARQSADRHFLDIEMLILGSGLIRGKVANSLTPSERALLNAGKSPDGPSPLPEIVSIRPEFSKRHIEIATTHPSESFARAVVDRYTEVFLDELYKGGRPQDETMRLRWIAQSTEACRQQRSAIDALQKSRGHTQPRGPAYQEIQKRERILAELTRHVAWLEANPRSFDRVPLRVAQPTMVRKLSPLEYDYWFETGSAKL